MGVAAVLAATSMPLVWGVRCNEHLEAVISRNAAPDGTAPGATGLMVHDSGDRWYQPLAIYPAALLRRSGVPSTIADRLPAALAAGLTAALTFLVAQRVGGSVGSAAVAAILLLLCPGFRHAATSAGADLLLVPMVLAWLLCVLDDAASPRWWYPPTGGLLLGVSLYTQPAGVLSIPVFFTLGTIVHWRVQRRRAFAFVSAAAVAVAAVPAAVWIVRHPEAYGDTFGRWAIHAAHLRNPLEGIVAFTRWHVAARRVSEYWNYFDPTFLFSREMFGVGFVVVVALGLWGVRRLTPPARLLLLGSALATPVAAVLLDVPRAAALVPLFLPVGALLGTVGLRSLHELTRRGK